MFVQIRLQPHTHDYINKHDHILFWFSAACRIANTLRLSPETIVRVYPRTEDMHHSPESQVCSQLCGCNTGCLHHLCFPEQQQKQELPQTKNQLQQQQQQQQEQENRQNQPQQGDMNFRRLSPSHIPRIDNKQNSSPARIEGATLSTITAVAPGTGTRITSSSACRYLPLADPQCVCLADGDVFCSRNTNYAPLLKSKLENLKFICITFIRAKTVIRYLIRD